MPPRQYVGTAAFQKPWHGFLGMFKGPINVEVNDLMINSDGEIAYSCSVQHVTGTTNEASRSTRLFGSRMSIARDTASG